VNAPSAILIDADTGDVLYEKNADASYEPENLTALMTALLAAGALRFDEELVMDREVYNITGRQIFLQDGERITAGDLLYAALLDSADDAAVALAKAVAGSVSDFVDLMNEKARELGCAGTAFATPHGRPAEGQTTTARDLALIARAAMQDKQLRECFSAGEYTIPATNYSNERPLANNNLFLGYGGAAGVIAGRPDMNESGLVAAASRDGRNLIAVVLGSVPDTDKRGRPDTERQEEPNTYAFPADMGQYPDAVNMIEYGFGLPAKEEEPVVGEEEEQEAPPDETPEKKGFLEAIGLAGFKPEGFSFYIKVGIAVIIALAILLLIALIRHRYTRDPYVRSVRYGRATREIKRVRRLK